MRLSLQEVDKIRIALAPCVDGLACRIYLFGSRVNDSARGGDIDLLLVVDHNDDRELLRRKRLDLNVNLIKQLGERRIDLVVASSQDLVTDPFLASIWPSAVLIQVFND